MGTEIGDHSKAAKLARVRENQRRSRCRKQQYVSDLEKRVSDCRLTCSQADLEREWRQRLELENRKLRDLLTLVGVEQTLVEAYLAQNDEDGPDSTHHLRPLRPKFAREATSPVEEMAARIGRIASVDLQHEDAEPAHESAPLIRDQGTEHTIAPYTPDTEGYSGLPLSACCQNVSSPSTTRAQARLTSPTNDTTLCSIAFSLVEQYNTTDVGVQDIGERLSSGFTAESKPGEGCRVQNQLLFQVLNEISTGLS